MSEDKARDNKTGMFLFLIILIVIFGLSIFQGGKNQEKVKRCKESTLGYTTKIDRYGKDPDITYYFYVDSIRIISKTSEFDVYSLHKFYAVKYNINKPI
jgi:hypothetical protein